jgi:hypothetical protein
MQAYRVNTPTVIYDTIDNEVVIVNFDTGSYYSLQDAGADAWNLVDDGATRDQIVDHVVNAYQGDRQSIDQAVTHFLSELEQEKLIVCEKAEDLSASTKATAVQPSGNGSSFEGFELQKYTDMNHLLLLDPIHEVEEAGWPHRRADEPAAYPVDHVR